MDEQRGDDRQHKPGFKILAYGLLTAVVGGLVALAVFLGSLLLDDRAPVKQYPSYAKLVKFDPQREGGHLLPDIRTRVQGERAGQGVRVVTNSKGFRNAMEFEYQPPGRVLRVLFSGDSFVDGMRTDQQATIGFLLQKDLDEVSGKRRHQVLISGNNNPVNAWYHYQEHGHKYHPHVMLQGVTLGNDLTWHSYGAAFLPREDADGRHYLARGDSPLHAGVRRTDLLLPAEAYSEESMLDTLWDWEQAVRNYLAERYFALSQLSAPSLGPGESSRRQVRAGGFFAALGLFHQPVMREIETMYRDFEATLSGFAREAERNGTLFVAALFPTRFQVDEGDWGKLERAYSLDASSFDLDYPNRRILAFCERENIRCFDLLPEMRRRQAEGEGPFYRGRGDMHFNEVGQELVAELLAGYINDLLSKELPAKAAMTQGEPK